METQAFLRWSKKPPVFRLAPERRRDQARHHRCLPWADRVQPPGRRLLRALPGPLRTRAPLPVSVSNERSPGAPRSNSRPICCGPARPGLLFAAAVLAFGWLALPAAGAAFTLDDVAAKARELAQKPFDEAAGKVPAWLLFPRLSYDRWRDIRFRPEKALWRDRPLPFQVQFFHPGLYYDRSVMVHVIRGSEVQPLVFSPDLFDYGKNRFADRLPHNLGFAGFRVHHPLNRPDYYDELIVFLGASYFRALARHQVYGLSARGIAIDTAGPRPEEFPYFREFWLVEPAPEATQIEIYALLDGRVITGAYRFTVTPGDRTVVRVECRLFPRQRIEGLGIAPLTSMFLHGENTVRRPVDYRPEVHDSDGLLLHFATGEWLWRPLVNPATAQLNVFQMVDPRGFGLLQRDRDFDHHQDLETRTDLRPSVWIEPEGNWGEGAVELLQLPTKSEIHDNIVAYWHPRKPAEPDTPLAFSYAMYWYGDDPARPPGGRAIATRQDRGTFNNAYRFVVDFAGGTLASLPAEQPPQAVVTVGGGEKAAKILEQHVVQNPMIGGWRLSFHVRPRTKAPVELRAFLQAGGQALTETWSYALLPQ